MQVRRRVSDYQPLFAQEILTTLELTGIVAVSSEVAAVTYELWRRGKVLGHTENGI